MDANKRVNAINDEIANKNCDISRLKVLRKKLYAIDNDDLDNDGWLSKYTTLSCIKEMIADSK